MAFLASLWAQYTNQLVVRPLLTKACTSSTLMSIGDTFTQFVIQQKKADEYDPQRTARMAFYGFTTHGPLLHYWYRWLDSRIVVKSTTDLLKKVVVDQAVFAPLLTTVFFGELELLKGKTPVEAAHRVEHALVPTLLMHWRVWPVAQVFNFKFVAPPQRVLFINVVALCWSSFLSWVEFAKAHPEMTPAPATLITPPAPVAATPAAKLGSAKV